jgi:hypothetical protein
MIRQLTYDDKDQIIEVIKSRDSLMLSKNSALNNYGIVENQTSFENNRFFGFFTDDNRLDGFVYMNIWPEMPAYSSLIYTRKDANVKRTPLYMNADLIKLWVFSRNAMSALGLHEYYQLTAKVGWYPLRSQVMPTTISDVIETVPAGQLPKHDLFKLRLLNRRLDHDTRIIRAVVLPEYRNPSKDEGIY